jgi:2-polyprenyl-6-methoxyphenol hydroxylase-like FAD-dependent oxidoreductase
MTQPILVVGAGPVGLTAALSLTQQGVTSRLIDQLPQRVNQSRAAGIQARTLEMFERLGVIASFLAAGVKVHGMHVMDAAGKTLLRTSLDGLATAYNFALGLGQQETERLLTEALAERGVTVERGVTLTGLSQSADRVTATLKHGDGREERFDTPYLLGCDGSKSTVRRQLGLTLEGETLDTYWVTADVRVDWPYPADEAIAIPTARGFIGAMPLPQGRWRVVVDMGQKPPAMPKEVSLAEVEQACAQVGVRVKLSDPAWISPIVGEHHQSVAEWRTALVRHEPHPGLFDCWDFGKGPHPGERAPDAQGLKDGATVPQRLHQDWMGDHRHQLLVFTGRQPAPERIRQLAELAARVQADSGELIRSRLIQPADVPGLNGGLIDHDGEAHHFYGARYECLYLIRPDGYVGFRSQPAEQGPLREYLRRILLSAARASIPLRDAA